MTPAARAEAAIAITDAWRTGTDQLDRLLVKWGRQNRYAGSGDRHAIANLVWDIVRCMRSAAWQAGVAEADATGRDLLRGRMHGRGEDPGLIFTGARFAPAPLAGTEQGSGNLKDAPRPVRLDYPDWLDDALADIAEAELAALRQRAELDLRVNTLKAAPDAVIAGLTADGITAVPHPLSPDALRVTDGARKVRRSTAYLSGAVEIQDAASQAAAQMAGAAPGMTVIDLCCGAGGKTLALAMHMQGKGRLLAHDIDPGRMADLPARMQRAGADIDILKTADLARHNGTADLVFADVPCSGSGAWRRQPDAKWRLTPERLQELHGLQDEILRTAATLAGRRGRILYATCSILRSENGAAVERFLASSPDWQAAAQRQFLPSDGGDGFFAARLIRR